MLFPLTKIMSIKRKSKFTKVEQDDLEKIKQIVALGTFLTYPDFVETFEIHTNAIVFQLGAVISQKDKYIAFYSRKLTDDQKRYTVTEKELIIIV